MHRFIYYSLPKLKAHLRLSEEIKLFQNIFCVRIHAKTTDVRLLDNLGRTEAIVRLICHHLVLVLHVVLAREEVKVSHDRFLRVHEDLLRHVARGLGPRLPALLPPVVRQPPRGLGSIGQVLVVVAVLVSLQTQQRPHAVTSHINDGV